MSEDTEILRRIAIANSETANLLLRIAAMQAENQIRIQEGKPLAYDEAAFMKEGNLNYICQLLTC